MTEILAAAESIIFTYNQCTPHNKPGMCDVHATAKDKDTLCTSAIVLIKNKTFCEQIVLYINMRNIKGAREPRSAFLLLLSLKLFCNDDEKRGI